MATARTYDVSTKILSDQASLTLGEMKSPASKPGLDALDFVGFEAAVFVPELGSATEKLATVEAKQETAKVELSRELKEDRELAAQGYRWLARLHMRIRMYCNEHPEVDEEYLRGLYRFGILHNANARGVLYELRVVLPELKKMLPELASVRVDEKFFKEGRRIHRGLGSDREETKDAEMKQKKLTSEVREAELAVAKLLRSLELADEAAALEHPEGKRWFPLDIIETERGRVKAAYEARVAPIPEETLAQEAHN